MTNSNEFKDLRELTEEQIDVIQFLCDGYGSVELSDDGYVLLDYSNGGHEKYILKQAGELKFKFKLYDAMVFYNAFGDMSGKISKEKVVAVLKKSKEDLAEKNEVALVVGKRGASYAEIRFDGEEYGAHVPNIVEAYIDALHLGLDKQLGDDEEQSFVIAK